MILKYEKDLYCSLFDKAMLALNEKYIEGTYDYISENHKDLYQELEQLEAEFERLWGHDMAAFRTILVQYYKQTLVSIQIYKSNIRDVT